MSKITKSLGTIVLLALSVFVLQGALIAQVAKFQQMSGDTGLVCMEAENYSNIRESAVNTYWELVTGPENYSGTGAMQALPAGYNEHKDINNAQDYAPVLEYAVNFVNTDLLYVWARSSHIDGYDDSVWFGLDTLIEGNVPLSYTTAEQPFSDTWHWISHLMTTNEDRATLKIFSTGVHIFELYMREPSFKVDKIVLTTDADYIPDENDEMGPSETLVATGVESSGSIVPHELQLAQNYPNPFNPETTFRYSLPTSDFVTFSIYNLAGQEVARLVNSI